MTDVHRWPVPARSGLWGGRVSPQLRFVDRAGRHWRVCELTSVGRSRAGDGRATLARVSALCFSSPAGTRRLAQYPRDWMRLAPAELEALCRSAAPVGASQSPFLAREAAGEPLSDDGEREPSLPS